MKHRKHLGSATGASHGRMRHHPPTSFLDEWSRMVLDASLAAADGLGLAAGVGLLMGVRGHDTSTSPLLQEALQEDKSAQEIRELVARMTHEMDLSHLVACRVATVLSTTSGLLSGTSFGLSIGGADDAAEEIVQAHLAASGCFFEACLLQVEKLKEELGKKPARAVQFSWLGTLLVALESAFEELCNKGEQTIQNESWDAATVLRSACEYLRKEIIDLRCPVSKELTLNFPALRLAGP